ncbi:hypothetical protein SAMN05660359_04498 [Geodermatophilus obscurus]|uniref:Uncharacterized protein n=1 Tax=Geodermatophilus obscurus TaxID=1861 RepID=A0A1I5ICR0_9ACTN|nr:hypothetical protein [Geodermatophilus obscurus]SFO58244.1 hypothetical protein SAMN05660359_04498 [Geodermatophilus obscurus]
MIATVLPARRLALTGACALALLGGAIATATPAAAADPFTACKSGGFVNYTDPLTGEPFANQGRCVSTLARGGAIVPVAPPVTLDMDVVAVNPYVASVTLTITGPDGDYPVTVTIRGHTTPYTVAVTGGTGSLTFPAPLGSPVVITVEGQTLTVTATPDGW